MNSRTCSHPVIMFWKKKIMQMVERSTVTKSHKCLKVWWIYGTKGFVRVEKTNKLLKHTNKQVQIRTVTHNF